MFPFFLPMNDDNDAFFPKKKKGFPPSSTSYFPHFYLFYLLLTLFHLPGESPPHLGWGVGGGGRWGNPKCFWAQNPFFFGQKISRKKFGRFSICPIQLKWFEKNLKKISKKLSIFIKIFPYLCYYLKE